MVERICPRCQHGNLLENRFCGHCGAPLERTELEARRQTGTGTPISLPLTSDLPIQLRQVGQALAVSLAALVVEAGLAWVRRRVERMGQPASQPTSQPVIQPISPHPTVVSPPYPGVSSSHLPVVSPPAPSAPSAPSARATVTIWSQRVVEVWEQGNLSRQTIERHVWRREEE
ncbi:MAG: zinc ribbon domain-containing protein [Chloroflexaceae bacterium]|nr:zinc ribbon domain-containing protein [Chloroflexaceae bacterium]